LAQQNGFGPTFLGGFAEAGSQCFFYQKLIICSAGAMASVPRQISTQLATVFLYNTIECVAYRQACGDTLPPPPPPQKKKKKKPGLNLATRFWKSSDFLARNLDQCRLLAVFRPKQNHCW
jgi:hypothetical protein